MLGLFLLVTLLAHQFLQSTEMPICTAAWSDRNRLPTFSDTLAVVRQQCQPATLFGSIARKS